MGLASDDVARRRAAKRFNERVKLTATFLNNSGIATLVGAFVLPAVQDAQRLGWVQWASVAGALALHLMAQLVLTLFRSED
jgi:hypothetical protein